MGERAELWRRYVVDCRSNGGFENHLRERRQRNPENKAIQRFFSNAGEQDRRELLRLGI